MQVIVFLLSGCRSTMLSLVDFVIQGEDGIREAHWWLECRRVLFGSVDDERADPVWQARIAQRMREFRLPARTVLAHPDLSLAELMQLKAGDIIPVTINRSLPLLVGYRIVAHGSIDEQDRQSVG